MANFYEACLRRKELQIEPILSEGYGVMKALREVIEVLADAYALQRDVARRYPTSRR